MKKTNKGFSMVELIIVIAIMAILAGALAPALIKYINKSRISSDIQTGQTIATSIQTALSNEAAFDDAPTLSAQTIALLAGNGNFTTEYNSAMGGGTAPVVKSKKDMAGTAYGTQDFLVDVDPVNNIIKVYLGDVSHEVYPNVAASLQ